LKTAEGNRTLGATDKGTKHESCRLQKSVYRMMWETDCWIMWK